MTNDAVQIDLIYGVHSCDSLVVTPTSDPLCIIANEANQATQLGASGAHESTMRTECVLLLWHATLHPPRSRFTLFYTEKT